MVILPLAIIGKSTEQILFRIILVINITGNKVSDLMKGGITFFIAAAPFI